ncbi:hemerythrin domain-containing protein [Pollutimonas sp. M17]|uniref:hemerythrin domain-containing protein n=1 Tax=Pollutimonas sp. M17 TaxID=2962065 RepID=UPI0021F40CEA|nr:hemerythrin domain-containing protein [Pollutimonas sp. M17]UYO92180.1 hemerythrin domain-containing protein [Pollutimonas sp. M17]HWK70225.1 hemerythrin domain-containing protein [Burkholderiaceae bacterium]
MNKSEIPAAQKAALSLLLDDHKKVKKIFKDFEKEKDSGAKQKMVEEACTELTIHTKIEEEKFYPYLRDQNPEAFGDLLDEALVEHASAKELIAQLQGMGPDDDLYDAKFTVLGEYVNHHVTEEEDELFPKVISKKIDLKELAQEMESLKQELASTAVAA